MQVERMILGMFNTNTYLLTEGDNAIIIDPASKAEKLYPLFENKKLLAVLLTHGHFDHIKACDDLYKKYKCPIYIHRDDEALARDKNQRVVFGLPVSPYITSPVEHYKEGHYTVGPFNFEVIYTPGHSDGSVCILFDDCLFSGDTLFYMSVGRTDIGSGSDTKLKDSLRKLKELNPDLVVYPGHDEITKLDFEIKNNPYL